MPEASRDRSSGTFDQKMHSFLRTTVLAFMLGMIITGCDDPNEERFTSSLRDDLSGVWVYPSEQLGITSITVVEDHKWRSYTYSESEIDTKTETNQTDAGEVLGEEGVYFFANPTNFYNPAFYQKSPTGVPFIILTRSTYDNFNKTGTLPVGLWIRVADSLDPAHPPKRPSIKSLGIPYYNIFEEKNE